MLQLKSMREISLMRQAGLAVWQAHQIAGEMMKPGVTTAEIDKSVEQYFQRIVAVPLFKNYPNPTRGKPVFPAVTCMSVNDEVVHGIPSNRPLVEGDILSMDTGCRLNGWCGDAARTHAIGQIDPQVQKLLDVTQGVLDLAIDLMGAKSCWSEVAIQMAQYVRDHGFSTVECFVGHGVVGRCMRTRRSLIISVGLCVAVGTFGLSPGW